MSAFTNCNHGAGLAAIMPVYYRHILRDGQKKFAMFAENVWGISPEHRTEEEMAEAGLAALEEFIASIGLPTNLRELGFGEAEKEMLPAIADSVGINHGGYRALTRGEVLEILQESW
jgi:alcohol dehydrogenase YqhD (iron-dependent ADH family)